VMQHAGMSDGAGEIVMCQPRVKLHRVGEGIGLSGFCAG
jgi:hypothetical protein